MLWLGEFSVESVELLLDTFELLISIGIFVGDVFAFELALARACY